MFIYILSMNVVYRLNYVFLNLAMIVTFELETSLI